MFKDLLLENFDMKQFLKDRNYTIKKIGGVTENLLNPCPFCGKIDHCGINFDNGRFGCFRCHTAGDFIKLTMKVSSKNYFEVLEMLKSKVDDKHIDIRFIGNIIEEGKKSEVIENKIKPVAFPEGYISLHNKEIPYTKKRKITQDQINYYRMGVCYEGKYKNRLIVCDVNDKQEVIYWVARDITDKVPKKFKLLNPSSTELNGVGSSDLLFNWYLTKNYSCAIITEGVFDALWIGNNGVATYGYGLKRQHVSWLIKGGFEEVYLMYDSDVKNEELEKYALMIAQFCRVRICRLPKGDPDEYTREELIKIVQDSELFNGGKSLSRLELDLCN